VVANRRRVRRAGSHPQHLRKLEGLGGAGTLAEGRRRTNHYDALVVSSDADATAGNLAHCRTRGSSRGAATVTALVGKGDDDQPSGLEQRSSPPTNPLPRCRAGQLALATDILGGDPFVVLRHVSGPSCDVGRMTVSITVRDQRGERAPVQSTRDAFTGEISPGLEILERIIYLAWCDQKPPLLAEIRAGDLTTTRRLGIQGCEDRDVPRAN
jgi:hypothetical protein